MWIHMFLSSPPASSRMTLVPGSSDSRAAITHPAEPAPTMTKSASAISMFVPRSSLRCHRLAPADHVDGFFGDHDGRGIGVSRRHGGHDGCVDNAQPLDPVHTQFRIDNGHG